MAKAYNLQWIFKIPISFLFIVSYCSANDILGCGGFVRSHVTLDFSKIEIGLYTKEGILKEKTECAPTNGYYFLPLYEKGNYILKVHPPPGWSFEPSMVELSVDGTSDRCSTGQDINFAFNGFGIAGRVITAGQKQGPSGVLVQLVNDKGEIRDTVTAVGGDFHFTPVIPGKYTVKASHERWKLDPSQAVVQVKEGNTALPIGVLAVKGYDVKGSVSSYGNPISGIYVLLYSKEDPKFKVEGCTTALLQGVPESPICHSITDASGEFSFGLVPAGEYKLLALSKSPGQATISHIIKPDSVPFNVLHNSLYLKNAFEVTGFTVVGSVSAGSGPLAGARVLRDGAPVGTTDDAGRYTLQALQPGNYAVSFQHEQCEVEAVQVSVSGSGTVSVPRARAARWRVCGAVASAGGRNVRIEGAEKRVVPVTDTQEGKWCTFLTPGVYSASVEVSQQELNEGLQFYPLSQQVRVVDAPVQGVVFSQLKARVSGVAVCVEPHACEGLTVTLRPVPSDPNHPPLTTTIKDGAYSFSDVLPGSVEVSVGGAAGDRLCWRRRSHVVTVAARVVAAPQFEHTGYLIRVHSSHDIEVEYTSKSAVGTLSVPAGHSEQCVGSADRYTLVPRGCHRFQPTQATIDVAKDPHTTIHFVAVSHAAVIRVLSPEPVTDLVLQVLTDGHGSQELGPLEPHAHTSGGYYYEHTLYMAEAEVAVVSARSSRLLFTPRAPQQVVGRRQCQPAALTLHASPGLLLTGHIVPPVRDVTVTLTSDEMKETQVTSEEGSYRFGPLDPSQRYSVVATKESYVFGAPDARGDIAAHKLAEITVQLVDDTDSTPLQGALVSVSGGSYRRNLGSGADGTLRFGSLAPDQYYVKPLMKEYRFTPPHQILNVEEGRTHHLTLRGVRVAWSCIGTLESLGGVGWGGATVVATPTPAAPPHCALEDGQTETSGAFRIRGLTPGCEYTIQLKESAAADTAHLRLVKAPKTIQVREKRDISDVRLIAIQPPWSTDATVVVHTPNVDHYKSLRLTVASDDAPHAHIYNTKLDAAGYTAHNNPGLMYALPRLPADNRTYILQLDSTLSKSTHHYKEEVHYFVSDGKFKHFTIEFLPKMRTSEQELRHSSILVIPVLGMVALAFLYRSELSQRVVAAPAPRARTPRDRAERSDRTDRPDRSDRPDLLDRATIEQIVSSVNAAGKKTSKKKIM